MARLLDHYNTTVATELATKFGLAFATTHDPLLRADPAAFWAERRIIASIATARRDCTRTRAINRTLREVSDPAAAGNLLELEDIAQGPALSLAAGGDED